MQSLIGQWYVSSKIQFFKPCLGIDLFFQGTPSGFAFFLDPEVNKMMKKVLDEWGRFLKVSTQPWHCLSQLHLLTFTQSPKSAEVLTATSTGWFSPHGKSEDRKSVV